MNPRHIQTVCQRLVLEIGYAGDIDASGLTAAIREALEKGGVLKEGEVVYIKAEAPEERYFHTDVWAPDVSYWKGDISQVELNEKPLTFEEIQARYAELDERVFGGIEEQMSITCTPCYWGLHEKCDNICKEGYWKCECCYTQAKRQAKERHPNW